ncbi:Wax ester synthase-like Acyl-CoA acyltransferase domain [Plasmodiophora brassicae]
MATQTLLDIFATYLRHVLAFLNTVVLYLAQCFKMMPDSAVPTGPSCSDGTRFSRRMSFISRKLYESAFPLDAHVPTPITHLLFRFADGCPSRAALCKSVRDGILQRDAFWRFRSTLLPGATDFTPLDIDEIDLSQCVLRHDVDLPDDAAVHAFIETICLDSFPVGRPLWSMHILPPNSVLVRIHHALADGIGQVHVLSSIVEGATHLTAKSAAVHRPSVPPTAYALNTLRSLFKLLVLPLRRDSHTALTSHPVCTPPYAVLCAPPIRLAALKSIKNAAGCTINDVVMTALAGACRRYVSRNDPSAPLTNLSMRAMVPFAFSRSSSDPVHNLWCFLSVPLQVSASDSTSRLKGTVDEMTRLKTSPEPYLQLGLQKLIAKVVPESLQRQVVRDLFLSHSIVISNVPGPQVPVVIAGSTVTGVQTFMTNILPQMLVSSYNGVVNVSLTVQRQAIPQPQSLLDDFVDECRDLARSYNVDPACVTVI